MKNLVKVLLLSFLVSQSMLSHAGGTVSWKLEKNSGSGISDDMANAAIKRGIETTTVSNHPGLAKPWEISVRIAGGSTTSQEKPGYILLEKQKSAGQDGATVRCHVIVFGGFSKGKMLKELEDSVRNFMAHLETENCK